MAVIVHNPLLMDPRVRDSAEPAPAKSQGKPAVLDFFAGSGLVSAGLSECFRTVWANDISGKKAAVFRANHPRKPFLLKPIESIHGGDLPDAVLAWGSFPCQDLSLAGNLHGIGGARSGLVWQWLRVLDEMEKRPPVLVGENVTGLVSADGGAHYRRLHQALTARGCLVGAVELDAIRWIPQSRKRIFVIAARRDAKALAFTQAGPGWCHSKAIAAAARGMEGWVWWRIPEPPPREITLEDVLEDNAPCDPEEKTRRLLSLIPQKHLDQMRVLPRMRVFPGYRRIRDGRQVLELRFDGAAGCLRTPEGGSSRQILVIRDGQNLKTRLLTVREAARLMGAPPDFRIPGSYNDGYKAMGDAVAAPVARYLARNLLSPLAAVFE
ncbi:MAG: Modification methylase HhaI [Myxococcota bacterium]|nr:Modification methylase HhaI [Myxococcota bacterium]